MDLTFYDYWRSSSAYRVRIALSLKGLSYRTIQVDLLKHEQSGEAYRKLNPQGLVPALTCGDQVLTQSLAIIDWLDATFPEPRLIPGDPFARARALAQVQVIMADVQPLQNLRVLRFLRKQFGADEDQVSGWIHHWIGDGFATLEAQAPDEGLFGGDQPGIVDLTLVPQMVNARRYGLSLDPFPKLVKIDALLCALPGFKQAAPRSPDQT